MPRDQVLGHADEADGIDEYDNPLPDWWLGLFLFTILWAIGYGVHYHVIADRSQEKELAAVMAEAREQGPGEAARAPLVLTPEVAEKGAAVYATNCTGCHGVKLEGVIGPSLKDSVWIHGGTPEDIIRVITEGVSDKGMPTWGPILGAERIRQVAAYLLEQSGK